MQHDATHDNVADETTTGSWVTREVSLGNVLLLIGMLGTALTGVWQAGEIRATLEDGIRAEREMRQSELAALANRVTDVQNDVREVRKLVMANRGYDRDK